MKTPYPHQKEAAAYLERGGCYLFMEPRTGKTFSTILALKELGAKALILAPKSVLPVWRDELQEAGESATIIEGNPKKKATLLEQDTHHIITYESSWRLIDSLARYDVVVFDEALKLQNGTTKVGEHWRALARRYPKVRKWGLSGAPCPEGALQLANQMFCLKGSWMGEFLFQTYMWKYWSWNDTKYKFVPKPEHRSHPQMAQSTFESLSFKRSQKDLNMGDKLFELRYVQASRAEEKLLEMNEALARSEYDNSVNYGVQAMYQQAASSGINAEAKEIQVKPTKLTAVCEAVADLLDEDPNTQVVVMGRFTNSVTWLAEALQAPLINGKTSGADRDRYVKHYQSGKERVLVCQVEAVKMGLDFSAGGHGVLIYAEHSWSGDTFIQSTQRVVNITRKTPALIITYCTKFKESCVDESIYQAVANKRDFNARLLEAKNDISDK